MLRENGKLPFVLHSYPLFIGSFFFRSKRLRCFSYKQRTGIVKDPINTTSVTYQSMSIKDASDRSDIRWHTDFHALNFLIQ